MPPAERPTIRAWRSAFAGFGVKPTQHRNAAEALLRRLQRHGDIPSIGPTVDLGNLVSITHSLPVAVFDLDAVTLPVDVVFASGDETFTGIGSQEAEHPAPGEVIFVDGASQVVARRWCWKQGAGAATSPTTARAMYVIEGVDDDAERSVSAAADDLESLVRGHLAGVSVDRLQVRPG